MSETRYSLRELANATGVSARTIRLWVEQGIIRPAASHGAANGYRHWTEANRREVETVKAIRAQRFRMTDIPRLMTDPT